MGRLRVMVGEDMRPETSKKRVQGDTKGTEFSPAFHLRSWCRIGLVLQGAFLWNNEAVFFSELGRSSLLCVGLA